MEAIRQLRNDVGRENTVLVHVTLVPYISAAGELKTKPTQHSVRELTSLGIQPDVLLCRCEHPLPESERAKIARSEEHTSELQSLMRISYAVFCLKKQKKKTIKVQLIQS